MLHLKRTILNTGVTLTVVAAGALAVEGVASAHDVAGNDGVTTHAVGKVTALGTDSFTLTTHEGTTETIDTTPTTTFGERATKVPMPSSSVRSFVHGPRLCLAGTRRNEDSRHYDPRSRLPGAGRSFTRWVASRQRPQPRVARREPMASRSSADCWPAPSPAAWRARSMTPWLGAGNLTPCPATTSR